MNNEIEKAHDENYKLARSNKKWKIRAHKLDKKIANGDGQIKVYKEVIDKPKTVNTNNYINPKLLAVPTKHIRPFTIDTVREEITNGGYSYEMFIRGIRGLTDFVNGMIVDTSDNSVPRIEELTDSEDEPRKGNPERNYVCTDSSRNKFHRLLKSKDWKSDNGAHFLGKVLNELSNNANDYYKRQIEMMRNANCEDEREHADTLINLTKNTYFGITRPKSKERKQLFRQLRSEIRSIAAI